MNISPGGGGGDFKRFQHIPTLVLFFVPTYINLVVSKFFNDCYILVNLKKQGYLYGFPSKAGHVLTSLPSFALACNPPICKKWYEQKVACLCPG